MVSYGCVNNNVPMNANSLLLENGMIIRGGETVLIKELQPPLLHHAINHSLASHSLNAPHSLNTPKGSVKGLPFPVDFNTPSHR